LRDALQEREDAVQALKAEKRRLTAAQQAQEADMEDLQFKLAGATASLEEARQRVEEGASELSDLQAKFRLRTAEVDRLHSDLRSATAESERLKGEARRSAEAAATAEADKATAAEQWRHELDRSEAALRERSAEAAVAREQADRAARELRRLELEDHRSSARLEAMQTEVERLRAQVQASKDERAESERRLESQLEEERATNARAQAEAKTAIARAQAEQAAITAELEARAAECGRLRTEVAARTADAVTAKDAELRELVSLRAQVIEQRAEIERLRSPSGRSAEMDRSLRRLQESDATMLALKAELAQASAAHADALQTLNMELASAKAAGEAAQRKAEADSEALAEAQGKLRERASEVEKLHSEVRTQAGEAEQLRCEARSMESRMASKAAASVEAAKAASTEQWRRELQRLEDALEERSSTAEAAREVADKSSRDLRRCELDERRAAKRAEALHMEVDAARAQLQHVREEAADAERHIEDARAAARKEHHARLQAEGQLREMQHEARAVRDTLQQRSVDIDIAEGEVRKCRSELVEREREVTSLSDRLRSAEAELRKCRCAYDLQAHETDLLRRRFARLSEKERVFAEREQFPEEHVRPQVAEVPGLRTATELHNLLQEGGEYTIRRTPAGDGSGPATAKAADDDPVGGDGEDLEGDRRRPLSHNNSGTLCSDDGADMEAVPELDEGGLGPQVEALGSVESRRRELRRERAALEELRRQWKADAQRVRATGGGQAQAVLQSVRSMLDERASTLNRSIKELRALERSSAARRSGGGLKSSTSPGIVDRREPSSGDLAAGDVLSVGEAELLRRWRQRLSPGRSTYSAPGGGGYYDRPLSAGAAGRRSARGPSREAIDYHLQHLRSFSRDGGYAGRPWTARGSYDGGFA